MASVASFVANSNWFTVGPKSVTASWAAGDTIVVYSEKPLKPGLHFQVVDVLVKKGHP